MRHVCGARSVLGRFPELRYLRAVRSLIPDFAAAVTSGIPFLIINISSLTGAMPLFRAFTPFCAGAQMSQCEGQILYGPFEPIPKPPEALPSPSSSESGRSRDNPHNPSSLRAPRTGAQDPTHTLGVPHDPRSPWDRSGAR